MKLRILALMLSCAVCLSGCSLLERSYAKVEPHSSSYYESEDRSVLRAENYQDLVNDLLVLLGDCAESGTIWLYGSDEDSPDPEQAIADASQEVQRETPLGAYAVDYMTYSVEENNRIYAEIRVVIGYRRTAAQIKSIAHATSVSALNRLLEDAWNAGARELVVQLGYFENQSQDVLDIVAQFENAQITSPELAQAWQVNFYPDTETAGIVEIIMEE